MTVDSPPVERVLWAIGNGIRALGDDPLPVDGSDETGYYQAVVDEDSDLCETLVGASFVVCQTYVANVVAAVKSLHSPGPGSGPLTTTGEDKTSIISFGSRRLAGSPYSLVQVIDAAANYFKHRDEWTVPWSALPQHSNRTAAIITAAGATEGSTGNLRSLAKAVGNTAYHDTDLLAEILRTWTNELHDAYQRELSQLGLI